MKFQTVVMTRLKSHKKRSTGVMMHKDEERETKITQETRSRVCDPKQAGLQDFGRRKGRVQDEVRPGLHNLGLI